MNPQRKLKIESEAVRVLSLLFVSGKVKDPRIEFVSVHRAEISPDMAQLKVWVTSFGGDDKKKQLMNGLKSAAPFLQSLVGDNLKLRLTPRIIFLWDENYRKSLEVNDLIDRSAPSQD